VTTPRDVGAALRQASALRDLCRRLPHVPTEAAEARWRRFQELAATPESASRADAEALLEGWRRWWADGKAASITAMAARLPDDLVATDRELATYATAARLALGDPR
jgi:hypothetical protein